MKRIGILLAILALCLTGATTVKDHPACVEGPEMYRDFVSAVLDEDEFAVEFYKLLGCGYLKGNEKAEVLETGDYWVRVKVATAIGPLTVYTSPHSIEK